MGKVLLTEPGSLTEYVSEGKTASITLGSPM